MEEEMITPESQPETPQLSATDAEGAVSKSSEAPKSMTLEEINAALGKDFKDLPTALKSVKDTYSYVGKRREDILKEVAGNNDSVVKELTDIKNNLFFKDNPDYAPYRELMMKMGSNPADVASSKEFKEVFEKAKGFDDSQKLKSVLVSNPRLAASKDNLTKAREAANNGDNETRDRLATQAVLDSLQ